MFRERARTLQGISLTLDVLCICLAFGVAILLRSFHDQIPLLQAIPATPWTPDKIVRADYAILLGASLLVWVVSLRSSGVYTSHRSERVSTILLAYLKALALAVVTIAAFTFALKMSSISRLFFGYYFSASFLLLFAKQLTTRTFLRRLRRSGFNRRHALVIGAGEPALWFAGILTEAAETGYQLVGLLLTHKFEPSEFSEGLALGTLDDLEPVLAGNAVDEVFIVGGAAEIAQLAPVAEKLIETGRVVSLVTPLASGSHGVRGRITEFSGVPMISFGPMPKDEINTGIRRVMDVAVSLAGLIVLSPLMLAVAAVIKLRDPGPVIFSQERLGLDRKIFRLHKFRSMRVDAEKLLQQDPALYRRYVENDYKLPEHEDPRISRLGRFLRKTSLDELPQLWNVLKGEMTLVGARPIVPAEIQKYEPYADLLLSLKPGLTGRWQVGGRSDVQYPQRAYIDLDYVADSSLLANLRIMALTPAAVLRGKGAR